MDLAESGGAEKGCVGGVDAPAGHEGELLSGLLLQGLKQGDALYGPGFSTRTEDANCIYFDELFEAFLGIGYEIECAVEGKGKRMG